MTDIEMVNENIKDLWELWRIDINNVSDGYHTFWELYKHRIHLFIALCNHYSAWWCFISKKHHDWTEYKWWFIAQLETYEWQISYHLPMEYRDEMEKICTSLSEANKWDWHTSDDVLDRLLKI